jgi:hypothetical protein
MLLGAALTALCSAQQQPDPMQLLVQLRHKVANSISRIPRYLCTETVERQTFQLPLRALSVVSCPKIMSAVQDSKKKAQLLYTDRLRLDVAVIDKQETYSWVGEGRFGDQSLGDLVNAGLTSTGSFGSFLEAIFVGDGATFSYLGESKLDNRRVLQYGFQIPLPHSTYRISNAWLKRFTAYSGSFTADAETLDLLKLELHADPIPFELGFCEVSTEMDYTKLRMNNLDFLLPAEATTLLIGSDGHQSVNRTVFSSCHQFLGESKLMFEDQPTGPTISRTTPQAVQIPPGETVLIGLAEKIDPATAGAGDPVKGRLTQPVEIPALRLTLPKGTVLHGRICELVVRYGDAATLNFGLKWETMEFGGINQTVHLSLKAATRGTAKTDDIEVRQPSLILGAPIDESIGYLSFPWVKKNYQIPAGFESRWVSLNR